MVVVATALYTYTWPDFDTASSALLLAWETVLCTLQDSRLLVLVAVWLDHNHTERLGGTRF